MSWYDGTSTPLPQNFVRPNGTQDLSKAWVGTMQDALNKGFPIQKIHLAIDHTLV